MRHQGGGGREQNREHERGAVLIEFAIVLPLLLALVFGAASFGFWYNNKLNLSTAAREGARYGATLPLSGFASTNAWLDAVAGATVRRGRRSAAPHRHGPLHLCRAGRRQRHHDAPDRRRRFRLLLDRRPVLPRFTRIAAAGPGRGATNGNDQRGALPQRRHDLRPCGRALRSLQAVSVVECRRQRCGAGSEDGVAAVLTVLVLFALLGIAALVLDLGGSARETENDRGAADMAATAAALSLSNSQGADMVTACSDAWTYTLANLSNPTPVGAMNCTTFAARAIPPSPAPLPRPPVISRSRSRTRFPMPTR